jgi:hypothetical protein
MLPDKYALFSNKENASSENVEKVVKPPHTPVFQNKTALSEALSLLLTIPTMNPISIAPRIFVINVSIGKSVFTGIRLIAYLPIAPNAPPRATNKKLILFLSSLNTD